jgi:diguanylate cyclase (GGDEF)-like protein
MAYNLHASLPLTKDSSLPVSKKRPTLFIACSWEDRSLAGALQQELDDDLDVTIWNQNVFSPSSIVIDNLLRALPDFDFGLFIFAEDDILNKRDQIAAAPRDNVIFELGMFMAILGRERCFILCPRDVVLSNPTDLLGITVLLYRSNRPDGNFRAAVGPACTQIREHVRRYGSIRAQAEPEQRTSTVSILTSSDREKIERTIMKIVESGTGPTFLIFVDVDRFEALNRYYGTEACNEVITVIEEILHVCAPNAFLVRMGGDQFLLCFKSQDMDEARLLARKCIEFVKNWNWPIIAPNLYVTIGAGVAAFTGEPPSNWIIRSIHGCTQAKKLGGNNVQDAPKRLSSKTRENYTSLLS